MHSSRNQLTSSVSRRSKSQIALTNASSGIISQRIHRSRLSVFLLPSVLPFSLYPLFFRSLVFGCCLSYDINHRQHVSRHRRWHFGQFSVNGSNFSLWSLVHTSLHNFLFARFRASTYTRTHARTHTCIVSLFFPFFLALTQIYVRVSIRLVISYWAIVKLYRTIQIRRTCDIGAPNKKKKKSVSSWIQYWGV